MATRFDCYLDIVPPKVVSFSRDAGRVIKTPFSLGISSNARGQLCLGFEGDVPKNDKSHLKSNPTQYNLGKRRYPKSDTFIRCRVYGSDGSVLAKGSASYTTVYVRVEPDAEQPKYKESDLTIPALRYEPT